jgi:hypothetical protein
MNILRSFCHQYLNVANEVCELRPYLPYVFLVVLDYGRMAIEAFNLGWVSQHEVFFGVPLALWRLDRPGAPVFDKWVLNTPFILVDNACSLVSGREAYGWPKILATLHSSPDRWLIDPRNPTRFLTVDVKGVSSEESSARLLDIEQRSDQNAPLAPPDLEMIDPFGRFSRLTRNSLMIWSDLMQLFVGSPLSGFGPRGRADRHRGDRRTVLFDSFRRVPAFFEEPGLGVVTLKQFRDAADPARICYQALVESRLSVARYNRGGLLGLYNVLQGDVTGGFSVRLSDNSSFPIIESFGLEVTQERTVRGRTVSFLEPFFPFWMSVDLTYGKGRTICWRTRRKTWHVKGTRVGSVPPKKAYYNTIAGGAEQVWCGPYYIPDASFDIFLLEACPERLRTLCDGYLNADRKLVHLITEKPESKEEKEEEEEKERAYVWMIASEDRIFSKARSGAHIETSQIAFYVPLSLNLEGQAEKVVLATPFAFVDNPVLATTMREVQGIPAVHASIEAPSRFLRRKGPLLEMQVDVFAALGAGLPARRQTLLEVRPCKEKSPKGDVPFDPFLGVWAEWALRSLDRLMLKQFRDIERPDRACYQSLVLEPWNYSCGPAFDTKNRKFKKWVRIYRYPSFPLVETLGLVTTGTLPPREPGGAIADVLKVDWHWTIRGMNIEIGLGKEIR